jgi:hypothetical protein
VTQIEVTRKPAACTFRSRRKMAVLHFPRAAKPSRAKCCRVQYLATREEANFHKLLIRSVMTYACPAWELAVDTYLPLQISAPAKQSSAHHWKFFKVPTGPRFAHNFQPSICIRLYNKIVRATSRRHRKYKRLKLGGGQEYDRSSD